MLAWLPPFGSFDETVTFRGHVFVFHINLLFSKRLIGLCFHFSTNFLIVNELAATAPTSWQSRTKPEPDNIFCPVLVFLLYNKLYQR